MSTGNNTAILAFEDGSIFKGYAFGASKTICGESVFNTSVIGYQEVLTDPASAGQVVVMTAAEVGNYGINKEDDESDGVKLAGFVVRNLSAIHSNWRAEKSLDEYLKECEVPGISGVDIREIAAKIRDNGALKCCLSTEGISEADAIAKAKAFKGIDDENFVKEVSTKKAYHFDVDKFDSAPFTVPGTNLYNAARKTPLLKCAALDFGLRKSLLKKLSFAGFDVTVFPASTSAQEIEKFAPDAIFLAGGPGNPNILTEYHSVIKELIQKFPTFAVGLGHNLLANALGVKNTKLKFAHNSGNQPAKNLKNSAIKTVSQNNSYVADAQALEAAGAEICEINLNDNTVETFKIDSKKILSLQYYPDTSATKNTLNYFEYFYSMVAGKS